MTLAMRNTASGVIQTVKWLEYLLSLEYYNTGKGSQPIRFEDQNELLYNNILYIYVTLNHKTSHMGQFVEIEIYTSYES